MSERIIRVFPCRTKATPDDAYAFVGNPPLWWPEDATEVHVSVVFTWDRTEGHRLADVWEATGLKVSIGGPAFEAKGGDFAPGLYLKEGYTITSRGCPNRCWFCKVWRRDGDVQELQIQDGWNIADDNLLACSEAHIRTVFAMLARQSHKAVFSGGFEAARFKPWHVDLLTTLPGARFYFAYDTPDDLEPLAIAAGTLREAGFSMAGHRACVYVLIGYPGDTITKAETRLQETLTMGLFPFAMLYRDEAGARSPEWITFQRKWARPQIVGANL